ncbi:MAG: hypothetical protein ABJA86_07930 [Nocardioidaceae bacterium]
MVITLTAVLVDPAGVGSTLKAELFGVHVDRVRPGALGGAVFDLTFDPIPEWTAEGYEQERGRVSVRPDGAIYAFPLGPERPWKHRQSSPLGPKFGTLAGELCLVYSRDPRPLRWEWEDGFEEFVSRVHRHLFFEEYARRHHNEWPVEDAPHGHPTSGTHPIVTREMRKEVTRWVA